MRKLLIAMASSFLTLCCLTAGTVCLCSAQDGSVGPEPTEQGPLASAVPSQIGVHVPLSPALRPVASSGHACDDTPLGKGVPPTVAKRSKSSCPVKRMPDFPVGPQPSAPRALSAVSYRGPVDSANHSLTFLRAVVLLR